MENLLSAFRSNLGVPGAGQPLPPSGAASAPDRPRHGITPKGVDVVRALHLGLCTAPEFVGFACNHDFDHGSGQAWLELCRVGMDMPAGFADTDTDRLPLRTRMECLLKHDLAGIDPLHIAAHEGNADTLNALLSGPQPLIDVNTASKEFGTTALMQAAHFGNLEAVKTLLAHGADPRIEDKDGRTALHAVCQGSADPQITAAILEAVQQKNANAGMPKQKQKEALARFVNAADNSGDGALKALFCADSHENSVESARLLLAAGAGLDAKHNNGETALHFGARTCGPNPGEGDNPSSHNNMKLLEFLVTRIKETRELSLDMKDEEGFTPLARAAQEWREDVVKLLSDHGATDWGPINKDRWTQLTNLPPETTSLNLDFCTWLKSLPPNLPQGLTTLWLNLCSSLQSLPPILPPNLTIFGWQDPR